MASEIIWEENGILFKRTGTVTDKEVIEANSKVFEDSRYSVITYQISDYTEASDIQIAPFEAKVIAALDKSSLRWPQRKMRIALVTKDENFIPIVKMYFKVFEGTKWECRIFETLELAYDWVKSD